MPRPLLCMKTFDKKVFWNNKVFFNDFCGTVGQKRFSGKSWYLPSPLLSIKKLSLPEIFWIPAQKGSPMKFCGTVRQKYFDGKSWYSSLPPPSYPQTFSLPEIFWNKYQKGSSTKNLGTVRPKKFDGKPWYSQPPHFYIIFFDGRNFAKKMVPLRSFSALWDKKIDRKSWYSPPPHPAT